MPMTRSALAGGVAAAMCASLALVPVADAKTVTVRSSGKSVTLKKGDALAIRLSENLSTGYAWKVRSTPSALRLIRSQFTPPKQDPDDPQLTGVPGVRTFTFTALRRGSGTLKLRYVSGSARSGKTFTVRVRVT